MTKLRHSCCLLHAHPSGKPSYTQQLCICGYSGGGHHLDSLNGDNGRLSEAVHARLFNFRARPAAEREVKPKT